MSRRFGVPGSGFGVPTYDFEITPARPQHLWLEVRRANGEWVLQAPIQVR